MDKELIILEQIQENPHVSQRDLASVAQASLGMTNAILKRFAAKGLITIKKVNNRNIRYALTPEGMDEISNRSWSYFKRTIKNVVDYQDAIREIIINAISENYSGIQLVGKSDFDFIIEHLCYKLNIAFICDENLKYSGRWFSLLSENINITIPDQENEDSFSLRRLVVR